MYYGENKLKREDLLDGFGHLDMLKVQDLLKAGYTIDRLPLIVTFYARVSTDEEGQLHSYNSQITDYRRKILANENWQLYGNGFYDEGITGTSTLKRENFNLMIESGYNGKFDLIITREISRFARNTLDSIKFTRELLRHHVGVFFESDNILTFEPDSEFRLTIMASVAQEESRKTHERVKRGNRISIENHAVLGSNNIYGYTKASCKLVINEDEAKAIRLVFDMYVNKMYGLRRISQKLYEQGYRTRSDSLFIPRPKGGG